MTTFSTAREIPATVEQVFAAIRPPDRLARWWGPAGFSNTFNICEFKPGGRWSFTMHGPDGTNYPNENVFVEIEPPRKVFIQQVVAPTFSLTIELAASANGTLVTWDQAFENEEVQNPSSTSWCQPTSRTLTAWPPRCFQAKVHPWRRRAQWQARDRNQR